MQQFALIIRGPPIRTRLRQKVIPASQKTLQSQFPHLFQLVRLQIKVVLSETGNAKPATGFARTRQYARTASAAINPRLHLQV
jgi:hypothetical protein